MYSSHQLQGAYVAKSEQKFLLNSTILVTLTRHFEVVVQICCSAGACTVGPWCGHSSAMWLYIQATESTSANELLLLLLDFLTHLAIPDIIQCAVGALRLQPH